VSAAAFFRLKKLKGSGILLAAARHNRRAIQAELGADSHINPARTHLNTTMHGPPSPEGVAQHAKDLMQAAGVGKLRKDAVVGIEAVFSLPTGHPIDHRNYFARCVEWVGLHFGGPDNIMSADTHHDEAQPHLHVLLLPLVEGRMVGSDLVGNRSSLLALQAKFFTDVARPFGLTKPPARMKGATKEAAVASIIGAMRTSNDPALKSKAWAVIRAAIENEPAPFLAVLGLTATTKPKRLKSSTAIFTSTGRGPKKEPVSHKPYRVQGGEMEQSLSCVGFANSDSLPATQTGAGQPNAQAQAHVDSTGTVRVKDDEQPAACWDTDTGTFMPRPAPLKANKAAAQAWVSAALHGLKGKPTGATG
jgi:hypothetical protein